MRNLLKKVLLAGGLLPAAALLAQTDVNRAKYTDYAPVKKVGLPPHAAAARSAGQRPDHVHNGLTRFFPPVFNQDGGSCGSASRISYMFTHEMNTYRNLDGSLAQNYYPSHFSWLLTNGNSGKNEFVTRIGIPSAAVYGGQTYSRLFGSQDCADDDFGWMQGYDKWFAAMHNRMDEPYNLPESVGTESGREMMKNYLWNHCGDPDFHGGGIVGIGVASTGDLMSIASTPANDAAGVTGKKAIRSWGTQVDHAQTIVGYDDRVEFDLNGNGIYGEKDADEVGAWIVVNSWGTGWGDGGFAYCPYAWAGPRFKMENDKKVFDAGNFWYGEIYPVRKNYRPLRTIKLLMEYSRRSELSLSAGVSADLNAEAPERSIPFEHFKYAGDGNYGNTVPAPEVPMLGRWADGMHYEPMEFGYDLTDLTASFDKSQPLKYFFIIETKGTAVGTGRVHAASIIDYEEVLAGIETPFDLAADGVEIKNAGEKTVITVVVHGQAYYAPQNLRAADGRLLWDAPLASPHKLTGYRIYRNGQAVATVDAAHTAYDLPDDADATYSVTALYDGRESTAVRTVVAPAEPAGSNRVVQLTGSGFSIKGLFDTRYEEATIEYWLRPTTLANWNQSGGPGWGSFMFHANANGAFTAGWSNSDRANTAAGTLKANSWSHIAIVVKDNEMKIYTNGVQTGSVTSTSYHGLGGFGDLNFRCNGTNDQTNGMIDELRVWKTARTAAEIKRDMKVSYGAAGMPATLLVYYKGDLIDDNGVQKLRDYVAGNHAVFFNENFRSTTNNGVRPVASTDLSVSIDQPAGEVYAGLPVRFTAQRGLGVARVSWTAEGAGVKDLDMLEPSLTFAAPGEQKVSVTAYDNEGKTVTADAVVTVKEAPAPSAEFSMISERLVAGTSTTFMAKNPQMGYRYEWSLPGAEMDKQVTPAASATYAVPGTYKVTLTVTAVDGRKDVVTRDVEVVTTAPVADFDIAPAVVLKGEPAFLTDKSRFQPTKWNWMISGGGHYYIVNGQNSSLTIDHPGRYEATLSVSNAEGGDKITKKNAITVCNADSKTGLNFSSDSYRVTAKSLPLTAGQTNFTMDWWMYPSALQEEGNGMGDTEGKFSIYTDNMGVLTLSLQNASGSTVKASSLARAVTPQEWHHYAVTYQAGTVIFYVDGKQNYRMNISVKSLPELADFVMGQPGRPMGGIFDELRVWNKVLTAAEIRKFANAPIEDVAAAEKDNGLVLYYGFNQSGGNVKDATSNANDGVRSGFGPDGDAWSSSKGVFCLSNEAEAGEDVSATYLQNYRAPFKHTGRSVNNANSSRFKEISVWKHENQKIENGVTTAAHVDLQKNSSMTLTTGWDTFADMSDYKAFQTVTLPAGVYTFSASYGQYEGQPGDMYIMAAAGQTLPSAANIGEALGYTKMEDKYFTTVNSTTFFVSEESEVSLGLLTSMSGRRCVALEEFTLTREPAVIKNADDAVGYDLTVDETGLASLYLDYATVIPQGVKAYAVKERQGNELVITKIDDGTVPARTAVIIEAAPGTYKFGHSSAAGTATSLLSGTLEDLGTEAGLAYYTVGEQQGTGKPAMLRFDGTVLPAHTAYLTADAAGAPDFFTLRLVQTGIGGIDADDTAGSRFVYDLGGRRVKSPTRGLYLMKGRKVIVK